MKKLLQILSLAALLCVPWATGAQTTLTVANGVEMSGVVPTAGSRLGLYNVRSQIIYPASLLTNMNGGLISSITFYSESDELDWGYVSFAVLVGETNVGSFSTAAWDNTTQTTQVYTGSLTVNGYEELGDDILNKVVITFSTPYYYQGGNLLVEVNNPDFGSNGAVNFYGVTSSGASLQGQSRGGVSAATASAQNFMPRATFTYSMPQQSSSFYTMDFEGDVSGWQFANNATNGWYVGTAKYKDGAKGLYISNDGGTSYARTSNKTVSYAYTTLSLSNTADYAISYDWTANGESSYDYIRVFLAPGSFTPTADALPDGTAVTSSSQCYSFVSTVPEGWTDLGDGKLNLQTSWQSKENKTFSVTTSGDYKLVIMWIQDDGTNDPGAIDNIVINAYTCKSFLVNAPTNITTTGARISWTDNVNTGATYTIKNGDQFVASTAAGATYCDVTGLTPATTYSNMTVTANCSASEHSSAIAVPAFTTPCETFVVDDQTSFNETFDNLTVANSIPNCWNNDEGTTTTASYKWSYNTSTSGNGATSGTGHSGSCVRFDSYNNSEDNTNFLATQPIELSVASRLKFWYKNPAAGDLSVYISTDGGTTKTELATGLTGQSSWTEQVINLANYADATVTIYFKGTSNWGSGNAYIYLDDVTVEPMPSCVEVDNIVVSAIGTTGATISWTTTNAESATYTISDGANLNVTTAAGATSYTFTTLAPATTYNLTITTNCGAQEQSDPATVPTFSTKCNAISDFPVSYGFEDNEGFSGSSSYQTTNTLGACWRNETTVAGTGSYANRLWSVSTSYKKTGSNALVLADKGNSSSPATTMLVFPAMNFTNANGYVVSFWIYRNGSSSNAEGFKVYASNEDTISANAVDLGTYSRNYNQAYPNVESASGWYQYETAPITLTGTVYLIFEGHSYYGNATYVDDVVIEAAPSCRPVQNISFTNVERTSFTVNWENHPSATNVSGYQVVLSGDNLSAQDLESANAVSCTTATYTFTGLSRETDYYVYVRANCGNDGYGEWIEGEVTTHGLSFCEDIPVAQGSTTNGNVPFEGLYIDEYTQHSQSIYPASMLTELVGKSISSMTFRSNVASKNYGTTSTFKIGVTEASDVSSDFASTSGLTTVYTGSLSMSNNRLTITFNEPFVYNGGNLLVDFQSATTGSYQTTSFYGVASTGASRYEGDGSATAYNFLPELTFHYCETVEACPAVTNVTVSNIDVNSATVTWEASTGDYVEGYYIDTVSSYDPQNDWYNWPLENMAYVPAGTTTYNLTGLNGFHNYYVVITTKCGNQDGNSSQAYAQFRTASECRVPENIASTITGKHTATVSWEAGSNTQPQSYQYFVMYGQAPDADYYNSGYGEPDVINNIGSVTSVDLTNLPTGTYVYFFLRNNCGQGGYSPWVMHTFETYPELPAVVNLQATQVTHSAIAVTWERNTVQFADETQWMVGICVANSCTNNYNYMTHMDTLFLGLQPATEYKVTVIPVIDGNGNHQEGEPTMINVTTEAMPTSCDIVVADGTVTNSNLPIYGTWTDADQVNQMIYPADLMAELNGKSLSSMKFFSNSDLTSWGTRNVTLKLAEVDAETLTTFVTPDSWTTVYSGDITKLADGFIMNFTTPYTYQGGNLLVEIDYETGTYVSKTFYGITRNNAGIYSYGNNAGTSGTVQNFLPKVQFCYQLDPNACLDVTNVSITNVTANSAEISWMPGNTESAWRYMLSGTEYNPTAQGTGAGNPIYVTHLSLSQLTVDFDYLFWVRPVDAQGNECGNWVSFPFSTLATCGLPSLQAATNVTTTTATISATPHATIGTASTYTFRYWIKGEENNKTTVAASANNSANLTNLTPNTTYYYEAMVSCTGNDGDSRWTEPMSFTTEYLNTTLPYSTNFSTSYLDDQHWRLVNGNLTNAWAIGSAADASDDGRALYVSNDGGVTNAYTISGANSVTYAYAGFSNFEAEKQYTVIFDWKNRGEDDSYDYLRAWLVPDNEEFDAYNPGYSMPYATTNPTNWIAVDGGSYLNNVTEWQHQTTYTFVPADGAYKLVFMWANDGSMGTNPPAAVDNVSIQESQQYTATAQVRPEGVGIGAVRGGGTFYEGTDILFELAAETPHGYGFLEWRDVYGNRITGESVLAHRVVADTMFLAIYDSNTYTITAVTANQAQGTAAVNGESTVKFNKPVTIVATPAPCYQFLNWTNEQGQVVSTDAEYIVNAYDSYTFTANFKLSTFTGDTNASECDEFTWHGETYYDTPAQAPTFVYTTNDGCDSTVTLNLTINHSTDSTLVVVACESYVMNLDTHEETYTETPDKMPVFIFQNAAGCDSTLTLNLTINHSTTGDTTAVACDEFTWYGDKYTMTPVTALPNHTFQNAAGCDSTVTLHLTINHSTTGDTTAVACDRFSWYEHTNLTVSSDDLTHTFVNEDGCDSVVTLNLTINTSSTGDTAAVACNTFSWYEHTNLTMSSDDMTHTFENVNGCDSVVTLHLTINNSNASDTTVVACDEFQWINQVTYEATPDVAPTVTLQNAAGCDSVVTLNLTIKYSSTGVDKREACDSYQWINGRTYTTSNDTAVYTLTNVAGCDSVVTLNLVINNSTTGDTTVVACDEFQWINQVTYDATPAEAPTFTLENEAGCDSTVTLHLTINNSSTGDTAAVACNTFSWYEHTNLTMSSDDLTHTFENVNGCDSVVTLHLTINNSNAGDTTVVACDEFTWINQVTYEATPDVAPTVTLQNAAGCDSVVTLYLTVNHSTQLTSTEMACDEYLWHGVTYEQSGNYTFDTVNAEACPQHESLTLTINNSVVDSIEAVACGSYQWEYAIEPYTESGRYVIASETDFGCDEMHILNLTINNVVNTSLTEEACDSYTWNNELYDQSGTYYFSHEDNNGCTQVDTLFLTVNYSTDTAIAVDILENQLPYTFNGETFQGAVTNRDITIENAAGCDSVIHFTLNVEWNSTNTVDSSICASQLPFTWNDIVFTEAGTQSTVLTAVNGTDSTVVMTLNVYPQTGSDTAATACDNFTWYGEVYAMSNDSLTHILTDVNGCDSIITLNLTINNSNTGVEDTTVCDEFTWINQVTYEATPDVAPTVTLQNAAGCDSVVTLHLTVNNSTETADTLTICNGYLWHDTVRTESGVYTFVSENQAGCTHTETLVLTVNVPVNETLTVAACDSYTWNNTEYTQSGEYTFSHPDNNNCTQVDTLRLTISNSAVDSIVAVACDSYVWMNDTITESGVYSNVEEGQTGCSITHVLTLTVNNSTETVDSLTICTGYLWHDSVYAESGVYTYVTENQAGCTQTETLVLTVNVPVNETLTVAACDSYTWNNTEYTQSGEYTYSHPDNNNCNQVDTLRLTINNSVVDSIAAVACDSYQWTYAIEPYVESGRYVVAIETEFGCSETHILNLTINNSTETADTLTICTGYLWHDSVYAESGVYTYETENQAGCTHTETLVLTVNVPVNETLTVAACDSYTWNNTEYTESGEYTFSHPDNNNCTQVDTLRLTISNSAVDSIVAVACDSYVWMNDTITESGVYSNVEEGQTGCSITHVLTLTVNNSTETVDSLTICNGYLWHDSVYAESGVYTYVTENQAGCTQTETLVLNVNLSVVDSVDTTVCNWYVWNDTMLGESGRYVATSVSDQGCTDTHILNLTVNYNSSYAFSQEAVGSFEWYDSVYTESGTYTHVLTNAAGCDSVINMTLTIMPDTVPTLCDTVTNVTIAGVTDSSITVTFTTTDAPSFDVHAYIGLTDIMVTTTTGSATITGLQPSTTYYVRIQAHCDSNTWSILSETIEVTTAAAAPVVDNIATVPYTCDFEGEGNNGWVMIDSAQVNHWMVGTDATTDGSQAMYITNNDTANAYTITSTSYSFATRQIRIAEAGSYLYSFNWKAQGESSYDYLRAALVPDSVVLVAGQYNGFNNSTAVPAGAYALDGGRLNQNGEWQTREGEVSIADTGVYKLVFMWYNDYSGGTQPPAAIDNVTFVVNSCPTVQNVVADPTANSIVLSWTAGGSETSWEVTCGGVSQMVNTNAYTFSGLMADTDYVVSVRAICGADDSSLIYTETVHTPCAAVSIPYSENFDSLTTSTTAVTGVYVPCWNYIMTGSSTYQGANYQPKVYYSATNANSGSYSLRLYGVSYTMLPPMAEPLSGLQLTFNAYTTGASYKLAVGVMEGNTFVPVDTLTTPSSQHTPCTVYFGNYTGNSRIIAFRNFNTSATTYYTYMYIDDVTVDYLPSCVSVTNLTATATAHSVELSWADYLNSSATYTVSDATGVLATGLTATTYTVTGLNANTDYTFSVTANCSADASGDAVSVTVHTDCDVEALPFMEDFSASLANDACWRGNSSLTAAEVFSGTPLVLGTNNAWTYASSTSNGLEAGHYRVNIYSTSCKKWMVTPAIDLTGVTTAQLTFDVAFTAYSGTSAATGYENNSSQAFMVVVSTDGGQTWLESNATKWQNEGGNYTLASIAGTDYVNQVINLNQYIGDTVKIAFYAQSTVTGGDNNLHLDNIIVSEVPSCPNVMGLTLDSQDSASANISWNSNGADSYEVQVVRNNNVDTTVNVVVLDTTAHISGLMVDNDYQVSVRAICGANAGLWTNPLNIHIGYCVPNPTSIDGQGITSVTFGGMTNSTTHPTAAPYYGNYANMSGSVAAGLDATVEITYATGWTYGTVIWVDWDHSMSFDADELVYTGESLSTNPTTLIATFNIPATTATGSYRMRIASADSHFDSGTPDPCFTSSYAVAEDYTLIVTEAPACLPVSNLTASNVTANGATLTWSGNADSYTVYNMADATAGQTVTDTTVVLTGLNANTEYTYAVVSGCDTSNVATVTFATLCNAVAIPFTETFEENSATIACWSNEGSGSWTYGVGDYQTATGAYEGARNARMTHTNRGAVTRLVSPVLDFGQADSAKLTYAHIQREWSGDQDELAVLYRTSANGDWIELASYTNDIATWTVDSVMLPATAFQVAFQMTDGYGYGVAIDSIVFSMPDTTPVVLPDSVLVVVSPAMPAHGTTSMNGTPGMASGIFHEGDTVVATATPDSGYLFDYWSIAYLTSGTELTTVYDTVYTNPFVLNIDSNNVTNTMITLLANFQAENGTLDSLTIVLSTADATMGTTNPAPGTYRLGEGDSLMFVPVAYDGYHFTHWSYEIVGISQTPYISTDDTVLRVAQTWLLDNTINYVAYFAPDSVGPDTTWYTVSVAYDSTMGTVTGAGQYADSTVASLMAVPAQCHHFVAWTNLAGDTLATEPVYSFTVVGNVNIIATFAPNAITGLGETLVACDSLLWHDSVYTMSGTYLYEYLNDNQCASVDTLYLTVNYSNTGVETVTACNSYIWHGTEYFASTNEPTYTETNAAGCDSVVTLNLTINECSTTTINTCDSYTWSVNNVTYTQGGIYVDGNDTLDLTLRYSNAATDVQEACDSYAWIDDSVYTASTSTATYTLTNAAGCDSVVTLNLTIHNSDATVETLTACDSYQWNGALYTESNSTDTMMLTNQYGCDSIVTLNLTVNYSTSSVDTVEACNSYVWHGTEYFASTNQPTYTLTNAAGCDSVVTLNLTINQCATTVINTCDSYTWSVNNVTYTQGGIYVDGTDTLDLTLGYSSAATDVQQACDSYTWIDGLVYTASNSNATYTLTNAAGCDSVVTLNLTVNYTVFSTEDVVATPGYTIGNNVFNESTVFVDTLTAATGCDSVVTYNITIVDTIWYNVNVNYDQTRGVVYGAGQYAEGSEATLTAVANSGYVFMGFLVGNETVVTDSSYTFTVTSDVDVMAVFAVDFVPILADSVTFYVAVNNAQMGTTTPAPGAYRFAVGDTASVEAVANEGYHFEYWVVNALGMTDTLYDAHYSGVLPMQLSGLSIGVTAVFAEDTAVVVTYHVTGLSNDTTMGRVIGSGPYVEGSVATLTAMANSGFRFDHWSNGETTSTIQFIVTGDTTFTAYFVPIDGIEDADEAEVTVYSSGLRIIVNGATGSDVRLFDVNGRLISTAVDAAETVEFRVVATGVYLIKVGNAPAKRVLVVR